MTRVDKMNFGEKLKNLRVMQGLTQDELAQRSELTKGFISQIENDIASPSITTFIDILDALGTNPRDFFEDFDEKIVFSEEDYFEHVSINEKYMLKWLVPNAQKNMMEPTLIELEVGGTSKKIPPYDGEEFGYVLEGKLRLRYGKQNYNLNAGDTFYFKSKSGHQLYNDSDDICKVLWISTPPNF